MRQYDPKNYAATRNFIDGSVSQLSPYISRGVISTRQVYEHIRSLDLAWHLVEKFIQELAWRDYWQQIWIAKGVGIFEDIKQEQQQVSNRQIPKAVLEAQTGIQAIDQGLEEFYETGYMHNHLRMYVASIVCNLGNSHWLNPAKWMYYHLLDGDLASNHLSWQWVAGSNAKKKYYANQDNINTYCRSEQKNTFLDLPYEQFTDLTVPIELQEIELPDLECKLPDTAPPTLENDKPILLYNYYNLDPNWRVGEDVQRLFLLEPSKFLHYPVSQKCIEFSLALSENIEGIQVWTAEFEEVKKRVGDAPIYFKEHPLNSNYKGNADDRDWMSDVWGYYPSFFAFWKKSKKRLLW